jgi:hypothetical protein
LIGQRSAFAKGVSTFLDGLRAAANDQYAAFQERYFYDPVGFATDCIEWAEGDQQGFTPYQAETAVELLAYNRMAVRSLHGAGKTAMAAILVLWYALTREGKDWKIITTASNWRQLTEYLWPEIHKWSRQIKWDTVGRGPFTKFELQTLHLVMRTGRAAAVASDKPSGIEGAHADYIFYLFDEGKAIPDGIYDAAEGAFSGGSKETLALVISTPGEAIGRFYDIHKKRDKFPAWRVKHWSLDMVLAAGRTTPEWVDSLLLAWGENDPRYLNKVKGEFADSDPRGVIPLSWVEKANERWAEWQASEDRAEAILTCIGVDIGSGSETGDRTTLAYAFNVVQIDRVDYMPQGDPEMATLEAADIVIRDLSIARTAEAIIDINGIGAGTGAAVKRSGKRSRGFWAQKDTDLTDASGQVHFANWRSAGWWILREMLAPNSGYAVCLPPDDDLTTDLIAPHWRQNSADEIQVEIKDAVRRRIGRSTDAADAVIMAIVGPILCDEEDYNNTSTLTYDPPQIGH